MLLVIAFLSAGMFLYTATGVVTAAPWAWWTWQLRHTVGRRFVGLTLAGMLCGTLVSGSCLWWFFHVAVR